MTIDSLGNQTQYFYDSRNLLVKQIDPLGNVRRFEYDIYGRRTVEILERTETGLGAGTALPPQIHRNEYDENGNIIKIIDANSNESTQEFDLLDRRIILRFPDATSKTFKYDQNDNIIENL